MMKRLLFLVLALAVLASCSRTDYTVCGEFRSGSPIYPDYMGVTVPQDIAPLDFSYTDPALTDVTTTFSCGEESIRIKGRNVVWKALEWRKLTKAACGGAIHVKSSTGLEWEIFVSEDAIDYGLTYRLIAPGYEVYSKMGIYQRELSSYKEKALIENTQFYGCVNCHSYNRCDPSRYSIHIRGDHGATLLKLDDGTAAYNTKTDSTLGFCVYPYWHPGGDYIAYSTNSTRQGFHVKKEKLIEVFDLDSDLLVYDIRSNSLITSPLISRKDVWETFPAFSTDGRTLYFCAASPKQVPSQVEEIRYNLCKIDFDPSNGTFGSKVDTLIFAEGKQRSISFPKPSFDGRFLMYTLSDYGNFSIWHHEADLWLMDLETGQTKPLDEANSDDTESYHNWSSNSRWFVFGSRRDNGLYTRAYICHIDEDGECGKPFLLPQKHPAEFYTERFLSFNVPEFVTGPVKLDKNKAEKLINSPNRTPFGFK